MRRKRGLRHSLTEGLGFFSSSFFPFSFFILSFFFLTDKDQSTGIENDDGLYYYIYIFFFQSWTVPSSCFLFSSSSSFSSHTHFFFVLFRIFLRNGPRCCRFSTRISRSDSLPLPLNRNTNKMCWISTNFERIVIFFK